MAFHFSIGKILDRRYELDAGVVDENIDAAEPLFGVFDHRRDFVRLCHVGAVIERLDPELGFDGRARLLDLLGLSKSVEDDVGALARQRAGDGEADAAGRSGHEGAAFDEWHVGLRSLRIAGLIHCGAKGEHCGAA